jgi:excisionase family DNA binding protein
MKIAGRHLDDVQQPKEASSASDANATRTILLTVPQAAQQMGLSPAMVYKLILTDNLPIVKLGRSTRIVYASLELIRKRQF